MHLFLGSGTLSSLDIEFCSPSVAVHLEWSVLSDVHGSDHYPVNIHISVQSQIDSRHPNWIIKRADWEGFAQSVTL
jgi:hypothetical protein